MTGDRTDFLVQTATPLAASLGLEIWGIEVVGSSRPVARIYVDADPALATQTELVAPENDVENLSDVPHGVTIDQCAHLSRLVGLSLDVEDPFANKWILEVSSPGLERPFFKIDQLRPYVGREVDVTLTESPLEWNGRKKFCGVLQSVQDEMFVLVPTARTVDDPEDVRVAWQDVRRANLVHVFEETGIKTVSAKAAGPKSGSKKKSTKKKPNPNDSLE